MENFLPKNVTALIGAQWGDEGKGKWVDILGKRHSFVVRFQGGNNAGHTIYKDGKKVVLHQLPSSVLNSNAIGILGAGTVINPYEFLTELLTLKMGFDLPNLGPENIWISERAHIITPYHIWLDAENEAGANGVGSTLKGIGPTYASKANRTGLRVKDYLNPAKRAHFRAKYSFGNEEAWARFESVAQDIAPFVKDAEYLLRGHVNVGTNVLLEGAQGSMLDIDHGTYPYVTSSGTTISGACQVLGLPPTKIGQVLGVAKGYTTRVGRGPFPTEMFNDLGKLIGQKGLEIGSTTGRVRRIGWLDAVALNYANAINGFDGLILNKLDVLSGLPEIKIATSYLHPIHKSIKVFPSEVQVLDECAAVYEKFRGWEALPTKGSYEALPREAKIYIKAIEDLIGIPVVAIGTGPNREDVIWR